METSKKRKGISLAHHSSSMQHSHVLSNLESNQSKIVYQVNSTIRGYPRYTALNENPTRNNSAPKPKVTFTYGSIHPAFHPTENPLFTERIHQIDREIDFKKQELLASETPYRLLHCEPTHRQVENVENTQFSIRETANFNTSDVKTERVNKWANQIKTYISSEKQKVPQYFQKNPKKLQSEEKISPKKTHQVENQTILTNQKQQKIKQEIRQELKQEIKQHQIKQQERRQLEIKKSIKQPQIQRKEARQQQVKNQMKHEVKAEVKHEVKKEQKADMKHHEVSKQKNKKQEILENETKIFKKENFSPQQQKKRSAKTTKKSARDPMKLREVERKLLDIIRICNEKLQ